MSISLVKLALYARTTPAQKSVLLALAFYADHEGNCWASIPTIAKHCCIHERNAQRHIVELENAGLLTRTFRNGHSTIYKITLSEMILRDGDSAIPGEFVTPGDSAIPPLANPPPPPGDSATPPLAIAPPITVIEHIKEQSLNSKPTRARAKPAEDDYSPVADLKGRGVDEQTIADWLQHRKDKKLKVTRSVVAHTETEARKAGISLAEALQTTCAMGWQGFLAKYVAPRQGPQSSGYQSQRDRGRQQVLDAIYGPGKGGGDVFDV